MTDSPKRPLWQWVLLAILPSLVSVGAAVVSNLAYALDQRSGDDVSGPMVVIQLLMPLIGLFYLIVLSGRYVASGASSSNNRFGFVAGFGVLNTLIWFAGCTLQMSHINIH